MWATGKCKMTVGLTPDIKIRRVSEYIWITVRRPDTQMKVGAFWDRNTPNFDVPRR
jgi:hypothetical protein